MPRFIRVRTRSLDVAALAAGAARAARDALAASFAPFASRAHAAVLALAIALAATASHGHTTQAASSDVTARTYHLSWRVEVTPPPGTREARLWIALPQQRPEQDVRGLRVEAPAPWRVVADRDFGNRVVRVDVHTPDDTVRVQLSATVVRRPVLEPRPARLSPDQRRLYLREESRVSLSGAVTTVAAGVPADAHAIFHWVLDHMRYDKTVPGWGYGDAERACRVGAGNCTDYHSLFLALARVRGIPATFEMGYATRPEGEREHEGGYHCWAWFYDGSAWVPVDISEADKHPERASFYFGHLDAERIVFSRGRDVRLPGMQGPPLNYVPAGAYAEFDGRPAPEGTVKRWISYTVEPDAGAK